MAQTEHLPIYKAAYDCCLYFEQLVRNFPRYHKCPTQAVNFAHLGHGVPGPREQCT